MNQPRLYMLLLGCTPRGRHTEQHDVLFVIGDSLKDCIPAIIDFWPEAEGKIHIDAWREIVRVDGFEVRVEAGAASTTGGEQRLYFINLGGYKPGEFDEFHYKMVVAAADKGEAIKKAKATAFYRHTGFKGAESHIDDKYGIDVDDAYEIRDILPEDVKSRYTLRLTPSDVLQEDGLQLGYFQLKHL